MLHMFQEWEIKKGKKKKKLASKRFFHSESFRPLRHVKLCIVDYSVVQSPAC